MEKIKKVKEEFYFFDFSLLKPHPQPKIILSKSITRQNR